MTYQHRGKRFSGHEYITKKESLKRYFMLLFECTSCNKGSRLKDLKIDVIGRFKCSWCNGFEFEVRKRRVSESMFHSEGSVILVESKTTIGRRLE